MDSSVIVFTFGSFFQSVECLRRQQHQIRIRIIVFDQFEQLATKPKMLIGVFGDEFVWGCLRPDHFDMVIGIHIVHAVLNANRNGCCCAAADSGKTMH